MASKISKGNYTAGAPTNGAKAKAGPADKVDVKGNIVSAGKSKVKPINRRSPAKNPNGKGS